MTTDYLDASEYSAYGIPSASADQVAQASQIVDAYLGRTEGLLWAPDANGDPAYMARKLPERKSTLKAAITPGQNVKITLNGGPIIPQGSALVLDRAVAGLVETCKVSQVVDNYTLYLENVLFSHDIGGTVESGMCIEETLAIPRGRYFVTLSNAPLRRVISMQGRISYGRRGDSQGVMMSQDFGILTSLQQFGGAPLWQDIHFLPSDVDLQRNQVWTPTGLLMSPYSEVHASYVSGFDTNSMPTAVKQATAVIVKAVSESPASAAIKTFRAGEVQMERFLDSIMSAELKSMLNPLRAKWYV